MALLIPNSTQIPNRLLDEIMPTVECAEWKVLTFVCRKTFGWQKFSDRISLSQFERGTGLSRPWLVKILGRLKDRGLLVAKKSRAGDVYGIGELNLLVKSVNQSTQLTKTGELSFETGEPSLPTKPTRQNQETKTTRGTRIPDNFAVTESHREFAKKNNLPPPESQIDEFVDYWRAVPGSRGLKLDWNATFRNRLRETGARRRGGAGANGNHSIIRDAAERVARDIA